MNKADIIVGIIVDTKRTGTSALGNPTFRVTIRDKHGDLHSRTTKVNSSIAYAITNSEYRKTAHAFELNGQGRIVGAEIA